MLFDDARRQQLEAAASGWSSVYGAMMDKASDVAAAMDDGRPKTAKAAMDKVAALAKRLQTIITVAQRTGKVESFGEGYKFTALNRRRADKTSRSARFEVRALKKDGSVSKARLDPKLDAFVTKERAKRRCAELEKLNPGSKYVVVDRGQTEETDSSAQIKSGEKRVTDDGRTFKVLRRDSKRLGVQWYLVQFQGEAPTVMARRNVLRAKLAAKGSG